MSAKSLANGLKTAGNSLVCSFCLSSPFVYPSEWLFTPLMTTWRKRNELCQYTEVSVVSLVITKSVSTSCDESALWFCSCDLSHFSFCDAFWHDGATFSHWNISQPFTWVLISFAWGHMGSFLLFLCSLMVRPCYKIDSSQLQSSSHQFKYSVLL